MKKVLFTLLMMTCNSLSAQTTLNESGVYEMKEVVQVDGVNAQTLYLRALEALSDWTGTEGRSKFGIDHQDKESATIIYKGKDYLGFRRYMMYGWYIFADFTLKVRCKDGRAQVTVTVPSMTAEFMANNVTGSIPLREITPEYTYKGNLNCKKAMLQYVVDIPSSANRIIALMKKKLNQEVDDF